MCGIFGYVGQSTDLGSSLTKALKTLEYRGYDSWGIAVGAGDQILVEKQTGALTARSQPFRRPRLDSATRAGRRTAASPRQTLIRISMPAAALRSSTTASSRMTKSCGRRSSPAAISSSPKPTARLSLTSSGEDVAAGFELIAAVARVFKRLAGLNAIIAMDVRSGQLAAAKHVSPLVVGVGPHGVTIASDALALHPHADQVVYLEDTHLVRLDAFGVSLYERDSLSQVPVPLVPLDRIEHSIELGRYRHFMLKEIAEQPVVLERLAAVTDDSIEQFAAAIAHRAETVFTGCGSAGYAALTGSYLFGQIAQRKVPTIVGSEFKYHRHLLSPETLVVALSQSGETADLIEAMLLARKAGARLGALVNVERSTLDRMVDLRLPLRAGPEQCVLATKSYLAKVAALLLVASAMNGTLAEGRRLVKSAAGAIATMLQSELPAQIEETARRIVTHDHLFVIGRGLAYPSALEAALKIKEASYIHAEAFAGGELKHGVIALVGPGTPCLVNAPNDETHADIIAGATELKSRGGFIIGISPAPNPVFDVHVAVADLGVAAPLVNAVPPQLLAYHLAVLRGHDPDRPRNLAKSVTVK